MAAEDAADAALKQQYPPINPEFPFGIDPKSLNLDTIKDFHDRISKSRDNLTI